MIWHTMMMMIYFGFNDSSFSGIEVSLHVKTPHWKTGYWISGIPSLGVLSSKTADFILRIFVPSGSACRWFVVQDYYIYYYYIYIAPANQVLN